MWSFDTFKIGNTECECQTKHVDEECPEYGIYGGKIIKMFIKADGEWIAEFERDPEDLFIKDETAKKAVAFLVSKYN